MPQTQVVGTPKIRLEIVAGNTGLKRYATYSNGSGTPDLTFQYTVQVSGA